MMLYTMSTVELLLIFSAYIFLRNSQKTYRWTKYYLNFVFWTGATISTLMSMEVVSPYSPTMEWKMLTSGIVFFVSMALLLKFFQMSTSKGNNKFVYRKFIYDLFSVHN
jgi:uncharacterized membrane protein